MATHTYAPILGKRIRLTRLDNCGNTLPAEAEAAILVTDGFISVSLTAETEDGTEIIQKNASGAICVNERFSPNFKRFNVEVSFCGVNPSALAITTNAEEYLDYAGDVAGITVPEGAIAKQFALELWTGLSGVACGSGQEASGYLLLPYVTGGVIGDVTIDGENAINFNLSSSSTKGGNGWGVGPFNVVYNDATTPAPAKLPTALDPYDHLLLIDTALAPPPSASSPLPMPS